MKDIKFKYETVADALKEMAGTGVFLAGKLPSEQELMKQFKVGKITIYKSLQKLAEEGHLIRVKGQGTFLKGSEPFKNKDRQVSNSVAVMMDSTSHLFSAFLDEIRKELSNAGCITLSTEMPCSLMKDISNSRHLISVLNSNLRGALIYGDSYYKNPMMHNYPQLRKVFMLHYDYDGTPPGGMGVFSDYEDGMFQLTSHLLEMGRRRIVLLRRKWSPNIELTESHRRNHPSHQMEQGYSKALQDYGIEQKQIYPMFFEDLSGFDLQVRGLFAGGKDKPDAVICTADYSAMKIILAAKDMGIKVPEDLAVAGFYNTSWSQESQIPITSVSLETAEMARKSVEMLLSPDASAEIIKVKPQLVIRQSTSGEIDNSEDSRLLFFQKAM